MHCKGIQRGHDGGPLLSAFALRDVVLAAGIEPRVKAAATIKLPGKAQQWLEPWAGPQAVQHGLAGDVVKGPIASTDRTVARGSSAVAV